ncbi:hypothetical protein MMC27_005501 [Xylographa pallens]|nr:hypothetical protein [Xylographa pallens]
MESSVDHPNTRKDISKNLQELLPQELRIFTIKVVKSVQEAGPYNLEYPTQDKEIKNGGSSSVYQIDNPNKEDGQKPYLACKKIALDRAWKIKAAKSELSLLQNKKGFRGRSTLYGWGVIELLAVYYVHCQEGGSLYLVLCPWLELSLQDFILYTVGKSQISSQKFVELAPWYQRNCFKAWPVFVWDCLNFLRKLADTSALDCGTFFRPSKIIDEEPDSIQIRGSLKYENGIWSPKVPLSPILDAPEYPGKGNGLVRHKDFKPGNIMLDWQRDLEERDPELGLRPLFVDFGLSKLHDLSAASSHVGTNIYRAPEQMAGYSPTMKSDIWSMGCCLTFIEAFLHSGNEGVRKIYDKTIGNQKAFHECINDINQILDGNSTQDLPASVALVRYKLRTLVRTRMMVYNPSERYNAFQLWYTWEKILQDRDRVFPSSKKG